MMTRSFADLDGAQSAVLADTLGDTAETVTSVHQLRRGLCRARVLGSLVQPQAAITQARFLPTEPTGFGDDPEALWALLRDLDEWTAVNVSLAIGSPLAALIGAETGHACVLCEELYYSLERPVVTWNHPAVRRLVSTDVELMEQSTADLDMVGWRFGSAATLVAEGLAAGAVIDGELVAVAFTAALADRHVGVGISTVPKWRDRGLGTAAAALVCADIGREGRISVWSTSEENGPSGRIAAKLGFVQVSRRVYVNLA